MIRHLEQALLRYEEGGAEFLEPFATCATEYADFHWEHMRAEEDDVMPRARAHLTAADWAEIDAAFADNEDPLLGDDARENYRQLFRQIVNLAPPPLGVGPAR